MHNHSNIHLSHVFCSKKNHKASKVRNNAQILEYTGVEAAGEAVPGIPCSILMAAAADYKVRRRN